MAAMSIRNLDDRVRERLRVRAAANGRSMESEVRAILEAAVMHPTGSDNLFTALMERFGGIGGVELDLPTRSTPARAVDLSS